MLVGQKHEAAVNGTDNKGILCKDRDWFEKQLYKFMKDNKTPIKRLPSLGFKEGRRRCIMCIVFIDSYSCAFGRPSVYPVCVLN